MTSAFAAALLRGCERLGPEVVISPDAENSLRPIAPPSADGRTFRLEVQGIPNLLHEFGHIILVGHLAQDHGTDPSQLPYRLDGDAGRHLLADELTCCWFSSRWHEGTDDDAHAWFDEQVGIQATFYGEEDDPDGFLHRAHRALNTSELNARLRRVEHRLVEILTSAGVPPSAPHAHPFDLYWSRMQRKKATSSPPSFGGKTPPQFDG